MTIAIVALVLLVIAAGARLVAARLARHRLDALAAAEATGVDAKVEEAAS